MKTKKLTNPDYVSFVADLKSRIATARLGAARAVNSELILLYWDIGKAIVEKQEKLGWGDAIIETLARDLQREFPKPTGFSARNLRNTRQFFLAYSRPEFLRQTAAELQCNRGKILGRSVSKLSTVSTEPATAPIWQQAVAKLDGEKLQQLVAEIPWGHHLLILNKVSSPAARLYYIRATAQFGWSRAVLLNQVSAGAYERAKSEKKTHNFELALPEHFAAQAEEALKSRYNLEFLGIGRAIKERDLEDRLIGRLQQFLLELGYGFCFVGRQHRLSLGRKEYFVDLLFYHRFLKALVAFDLKIGPFEPEHSGKMDFYLNLLNDRERAPHDNPSIGIILCAEKDDVEVEFALKTKMNPIGVAEYKLRSTLPSEFKGKLPTARQLANVVQEILPVKK